MAKQSDFDAFLKDIEPSPSAVSSISSAHNNLRDFLVSHKTYGERVVKSYLSGSYAKHTAIRNSKDDEKNDVDIVVELDYGTDITPSCVLEELKDVLLEKAAYSSAKVQSHSVGIELSTIKMDVVPLVSEGDAKYIGCLDDEQWAMTNPERHKSWSTEVNAEADGKYKPLVKILKWWRKENCPEGRKYPKGIVLETLIADNLPDDYGCMEDYVVTTMDNLIVAVDDILETHSAPYVEDPAIDGSNMAEDYNCSDFLSFAEKLREHLETLAEKDRSNDAWRGVLGSRFPSGDSAVRNQLVPRAQHAQVPPWRMQAKKPSVAISCEVTFPSGEKARVPSAGMLLPKHASLTFRAMVSPSLRKGVLKWQVVNTGDEAAEACCLRGGFQTGSFGSPYHLESTLYRGRHYIRCYLVKGGVCIAFSKPFLVDVE